jgi:hypothetical protein
VEQQLNSLRDPKCNGQNRSHPCQIEKIPQQEVGLPEHNTGPSIPAAGIGQQDFELFYSSTIPRHAKAFRAIHVPAQVRNGNDALGRHESPFSVKNVSQGGT